MSKLADRRGVVNLEGHISYMQAIDEEDEKLANTMQNIRISTDIGEISAAEAAVMRVGGTPKTAVVALRGTATATEWWNDFQWDLVPFTQVPNGGNVAQGFCDIYSTFGTMTPGQQSTPAPGAFAASVAQAATEGLAAEVDPADLPVVVTGHSLGGALATLLVADLTATTPLKPQAWTFASPNVGDATFAARYGALSTVSWRIYNQVDVVPYFPVDILDNYQPVTTGYAINSLGKAKWNLGCAHALNTYMHLLSPATVPLDQACS